MTSPTELRPLGARLADAEGAALAECYVALNPLVRSYLRRYVPDGDIDDVLQRVFVEVWRCQRRYDPARSLEAWVLGIARKRAIDHLRARPQPALPLTELPEASGSDGRDAVERHVRGEEVRGALSALPGPQREAIELAYYGELSQREIAERLDVPIGTIKARTARGLRRLGAILAPAQVGEG